MEEFSWSEFIRLVNDNTQKIVYLPEIANSQEAAQQLVQLANTKGGKLIIGFDLNNLQLRGITFDPRWLKAALHKHCKPAIAFDMKYLNKNHKIVIVIDVQEGKSKPYAVQITTFEEEVPEIPTAVTPPVEEPKKNIEVTISNDVEENYAVYDLNVRQKRALQFIIDHGEITNTEYRNINQVSHKTAHNELAELVMKNIIQHEGQGRSTKYLLSTGQERINDNLLASSILEEAPVAEMNLFGDDLDEVSKDDNFQSITSVRRSASYEHMKPHLTKVETPIFNELDDDY